MVDRSSDDFLDELSLQIQAEIDDLLAPLSQSEQELLRMRLGLGMKRRTLEEVAAVLGEDVETVNRKQTAALLKIKPYPRAPRRP